MKTYIRIFIFGMVVIASVVAGWLYLNDFKKSSKASEAIATIAFTESRVAVQTGNTVKVGLTVTTGTLPMSAIDLTFNNTGDNLDFTNFQLPTGFDEQVLVESGMTTSRTDGTKKLKRLVFVAKKAGASLPKSAVIPLYFKVTNRAGSTGTTPSYITTLSVDVKYSMVVGPSIPGNTFTLKGNANTDGVDSLNFTVDSTPLTPTPTPDCRAEKVPEITCDSKCGENVILKWKDVSNEDGYKIYKDGQTTPLKTLGKNQTAYVYSWCGDLNQHSYKVIAYNNACGSQSTTLPKVDCACKKCEVGATPTQGVIQPVNTADIILKLNFPDVAQDVQTIRNVRVDIMNGTTTACPACSQVVSFTRFGNYFVSPQLSFRLEQTIPYTVVVKQAVTLRRSYKFVYLQKNKLLNCSIGFDSACGQLLSEIDSRPMLSGDMNGFDAQSEGYNVIDKQDLSAVNIAVNDKTDQGDMNFNGISDTVDIGIVGKNFGKKGD